jgi:hypothetical protein
VVLLDDDHVSGHGNTNFGPLLCSGQLRTIGILFLNVHIVIFHYLKIFCRKYLLNKITEACKTHIFVVPQVDYLPQINHRPKLSAHSYNALRMHWLYYPYMVIIVDLGAHYDLWHNNCNIFTPRLNAE